jgi:amidase
MHEMAKSLPVNVLCDGVVTRTVRDTAHFFYGAEKYWRNTQLPVIGLVEGPSKRRLKIALVMDSLSSKPCPQTRATVEHTVKTLEEMGHPVELMVEIPVKPSFVDDFLDYWGFLAFMTAKVGKKQFGSRFDASRLDGFSKGLAGRFRKRFWRVPFALFRLKKTWGLHAEAMTKYDVVLTPVLGHVTPKLGYISPDVPYDLLLERLMGYASYTPLNNTNGSPAISLPLGMSQEGLPIAVQLAAGHGQERTLLELSFELEQAMPFCRIDSPTLK